MSDVARFLGEVHFTISPRSTEALGEELGGELTPGTVVALVGELGAGKTVFIKGLARGLGVEQEVVSPSFQIARFYRARMPLCHLDFYRLKVGDEFVFGLEEYLLDDGVTVIEWADRISTIIPGDAVAVRITIQGEMERRIELLLWEEMLRKAEEVGGEQCIE